MAHPTNVELLLEEAVEVFSSKKSSKSIGRQTWQPHKGRIFLEESRAARFQSFLKPRESYLKIMLLKSSRIRQILPFLQIQFVFFVFKGFFR